MTRTYRKVLALAAITMAMAALVLPACDEARKQECDALLGAMKPLDASGTPSGDTVDAVMKQTDGLKLQNQALAVYAKNYHQTLTVLSATLKLKAGSSAPDGTDDVIKRYLKEARTDRDDVQRLCSK
jgi:hypothetical protein